MPYDVKGSAILMLIIYIKEGSTAFSSPILFGLVCHVVDHGGLL